MIPRSAKNEESRLHAQTSNTDQAPRASPEYGHSHEHHRREQQHALYLDSLHVPTPAQMHEIAKVQEHKEAEVEERYDVAPMNRTAAEEKEREEAAGKIQRVYRGHRERRALNGLSLDPASRWSELIRDARYRQLTMPRARTATIGNGDVASDASIRSGGEARTRWNQIGQIARHAHGEALAKDSSSSDDDEKNSHIPKTTRTFYKKQERKEKEAWKGKMMDLPYFLEMVDQKHRYGTNLRQYHEEWKKADTLENFFHWLDHGEGKHIELSGCSREQLEKEQVRYLSREERMQYLVQVDANGKLRWRKNGELIDTTEEFRDSIEGIVPLASPSKTYRQDELEAKQKGGPPEHRDSDESSDDSGDLSEAEKRYPDPSGAAKAKGPKKITNVTPATILNRLMRKSVKKNTWIFVADTNMNVYVGIKQSGSFQHSSFIQGSRVSAAGLIKVQGGQLRSLAPLSGHYRPPAAAFKNFIEHLKRQGVDMSRVSISKSYAILVGLEAYAGGKQRIKNATTHFGHGVQHVAKPDKAKERKEPGKDGSLSAPLEEQATRNEDESKEFARAKKVAREKIGAEDASVLPTSEHITTLPDRTKVQAT